MGMKDTKDPKTIQTVPNTLFKRDFSFWENAVSRAIDETNARQSVYRDYIFAAGAPYYTRDDQAEGFGTNWHYPTARGVVATLMFGSPEWMAINPNAELREDGEALETIVTNLWDELQWSSVMRMILYYAYFTGFGATRTEFVRGVDAPQQLSPSKDKVDAIFRTLASRQDASIDGVELARLIEGVGEPIYQNSMERRGFPYWRRVRSSQFLMDPDVCEFNVNDARWMGEEIWLPLEFVRNSELYDKRPRMRVEGESRVRQNNFTSRHSHGLDEQWVRVVEIFDKVNRRVITLQLDQQEVLRSRPYDGVDPYDALFWNPIPEQDAPIPDASLVFDHATGKSSLRARMNRIIDSHRQFTTYDAEMVNEPETLTLLLHGDDTAKLPLQVPQGKRIQDAIHNDRSIPLPQEMLYYDTVLTQEIQTAVGASNSPVGAPRGGRPPAALIRAEQQGQAQQHADKLLEIENFLARHGSRTANMVRLNWTPEQISKFSGKRDNDTQVRAYYAHVRQRLADGQPISDIPVVLPRKRILGEFTMRTRPGSTTAEFAAQTQQVDRIDYQDMLANPMVSNIFATKYYFHRRGIRGIEAAMPAGDQVAGQGEFEALNAQTGDPTSQVAQPEALLQGGGGIEAGGGTNNLSLLPSLAGAG